MKKLSIVALLCSLYLGLPAQELFRFDSTKNTRWASFENPLAEKGKGGMENRGAKGHPYETVTAGRTVTLMSASGSGIIQRIWLTVNDRSPNALRSLRLQMFWDNQTKPAVDAPLGDFFGIGLGKKVPFENEFFSDPEGRSFHCVIPMPFRTAARILLINEYTKNVQIWYKVNFSSIRQWEEDMLYFHTFWSRRINALPGKDFEILPPVAGRGRYLGANIGLQIDTVYGRTWWGEGEVKIYLDGDKEFPSLTGTGTEDYIGSGFGQGKFVNRYQGCPVADEKKQQWAFYRFHVPDPVFFKTGCSVAIQQMGGGSYEEVKMLAAHGVPLIPVTVNHDVPIKLLEIDPPFKLEDDNFPKGWVNFYRSDDISAAAYFYLDRPSSALPPLAPAGERIHDLR